MEIHTELGMGFKETVYKEVMELEFLHNAIPFTREKQLLINYKGKPLSRKHFADFVVFNSIILEVKAVSFVTENFRAQILNYLKASGLRLGMLLNFGEKSFHYERFVM